MTDIRDTLARADNHLIRLLDAGITARTVTVTADDIVSILVPDGTALAAARALRFPRRSLHPEGTIDTFGRDVGWYGYGTTDRVYAGIVAVSDADA